MQGTEIRLAGRPTAEPDDSCFSITRSDVPDPADGQLLLRVVYLSLDPYLRGRMSAAESYADPVAVGEVMVGATDASSAPAGSDRLPGFMGWC